MQAGEIALTLIGLACAWLGTMALLTVLTRTRPARSRRITALGSAVGGALASGAALLVLLSGTGTAHSLFAILPDRQLEVAATPLGAFFWLLIGVPALAMGVFALGVPVKAQGGTPDWITSVAANLLILVLLALTTVADGLSLLILWQLAATFSVVIVVAVYPRRGRKTLPPAGLLVALPVGGACLLAALLLLDTACRSLRFADLAACGPRIDTARQVLVFLLTLGACGITAVVPLLMGHGTPQQRLPLRLAGKVALYPLIVVVFAVLGPAPVWCGLLLLALGAGAALTGSMRAVGERSLEAIVVHGGVSQIGAVLLGLGSAMLLRPAVGVHGGGGEALGIAAALLCALTGAMGATLLDLAARALRQAVGDGEIERWGGLARGMPWTGALTLAGIAGTLVLPLLGGVTGGWLSVQALLAVAVAPASVHAGAAVEGVGGAALLAAAVLGLAAAIGMAATMLIYGLAFLGPPRTRAAAMAREIAILPRVAMIVLAAPMLAIALLPSGALALLDPVLKELTGACGLATHGCPGWVGGAVQSPVTHGSLFPAGLLLLIAGCAGVPVLGARWLCGRGLGQEKGHAGTAGRRHRPKPLGDEHGEWDWADGGSRERRDRWTRPDRAAADLGAAPLRRILVTAPGRMIDAGLAYLVRHGGPIRRVLWTRGSLLGPGGSTQGHNTQNTRIGAKLRILRASLRPLPGGTRSAPGRGPAIRIPLPYLVYLGGLALVCAVVIR